MAVLVLFSVSLGLAACSSSSKAQASGPAAAGAIAIKNFAFSPNPITVKAGDTITISNQDSLAHTFTDGGGAFDTGPISAGSSKTVTIAAVGTYHYHCNIHPNMTGVIQAT
jgi:plastocyanin